MAGKGKEHPGLRPRSPQSGARPPPLLLSAQVRALPWAPCALLSRARRTRNRCEGRQLRDVFIYKYYYYLLYGENLLAYLLLRLRPTSHSRRREHSSQIRRSCNGAGVQSTQKRGLFLSRAIARVDSRRIHTEAATHISEASCMRSRSTTTTAAADARLVCPLSGVSWVLSYS